MRTIQDVMEDWLEPNEARNMRLALLEEAGCIIVPKEPTEAMIVAGLGADCSAEMPELENGWHAMIEAAIAEANS